MKKIFTALTAVLLVASMASAQKTIGTPLTKAEAMKAAQLSAGKKTQASVYHAVRPVQASKAVISTFPYVEDFETANSNWTMIDNDHDNFNWSLLSNMGGNMECHSGVNCMVSGSYDETAGALTPDNWLVSSQMQIPAGSSFVLSWWDAAQDPSYAAEHYSVYVATGNTVAAFTATTPVFSTTISSDAWTKHSVDLSAYAGQSIYIAFRHHNCTDMFYMKIDDIRVGGPEAPAVAISAPAMAESNTLVNLSATVDGSNTVSWTLNGATPATATGTSVQATWATAGTYSIVATATNAAGSASDTATINIYECSTIDNFPYVADLRNGLGCWSNRSDSTEGTGWLPVADVDATIEGSILSMSAQSVFGIFMMDVPHDNWITSPTIAVPATGSYELSWRVMPFEPSYANDHYSVYAIVNDNPVLLFSETLDASMTTWQNRVASLAAYAGQNIRVAFRHHESTGGYVILLDQIGIATLSAPMLSVNGPSYTRVGEAATFTANSGNADSYAWSVDGASVSETSATLSHTFTTAGSHTVAVTATNTVGSTTDTLMVEAIECTAINAIPFNEDFESHIMCWNTVSNDAANDGLFGLCDDSEAPAHAGHQMFRFSSYDEAMDYNQYLISPEMNLSGADIALKFWYRGHTAAESFRVLYSTTGNAVSDFTHEVANVTTTATEWTLFGAVIPANAKYVAIDYYGEYQYFLYVDDFELSALTAPEVTVAGPAQAFTNAQVTFVANGVLADSYSWTVDGNEANCTSNTITTSFSEAGSHTVAVTATNAQGSATATHTIQIKAWGDTMYYDNGQMVDYVGAEGGCYWAVKFDGAQLQGRNFLTHVMFYVPENGAGTYEFAAYQGGENAPQTQIAERTVVPDEEVVWQTIRLKKSAALDPSKPLWIVMHSTVNYPAAGSEYDGNPNSAWVSIDGNQWSSIQEASQGSISVSWMLRAITGNEALAGIDNANVSMSIYPNPTSNRIMVNAEGIKSIEVLDLNGRTVLTSKDANVSMAQLANGTYIVRVVTNNGVAVKKVVKK